MGNPKPQEDSVTLALTGFAIGRGGRTRMLASAYRNTYTAPELTALLFI